MPGTYDAESELPPSLDPDPGLGLDMSLDVGAEDHDDPRDMFDDAELDDDADDREHRVAHRPNPLPNREEDEEELAEADMHERLDLDREESDRDRALRDG